MHGRRNLFATAFMTLKRRKKLVAGVLVVLFIVFWFHSSDPYDLRVPKNWVSKGQWTPADEKELTSSIAVGIISSKNYHKKINSALQSWITPERHSMVEVFSDSSESSMLVGPVDVTNTGCSNTYTLGLWCKNLMMFRKWKTDPKYKDVKWFYRAMDDTWIHLENLLWLTKQYDPNVATIIGEKVCYWTGTEYPDGGPGFLMSRKFIEIFSEEIFNNTLITHEGETIDDIMWGSVLRSMKVKLVHYSGITHAGLLPGPDTAFTYYSNFMHKPWPLTFRPIASHQGLGRGMEFMPRLNYILHQIDYNRLAKTLASPADCLCTRPHVAHARCSFAPDYPLTHNGQMSDLGPGPWP